MQTKKINNISRRVVLENNGLILKEDPDNMISLIRGQSGMRFSWNEVRQLRALISALAKERRSNES